MRLRRGGNTSDADSAEVAASSAVLPLQAIDAIEPLLALLRDEGPKGRVEVAGRLGLRHGSGYVANKLAAARAYGAVLLTGARYELTGLGSRLLSQDIEEARIANADAIENVPLFRKLRATLDAAPAPGAVRSVMEGMGVPQTKMPAAEKAFLRSVARLNSLDRVAPAVALPKRGSKQGTEVVVHSIARGSTETLHSQNGPEWLALERMINGLPAAGTTVPLPQLLRWVRDFAAVIQLSYGAEGIIEILGKPD